MSFNCVIVDGDYIKNHIKKCKTQVVHFYPREDYIEIINSYKDPLEIMEQASKVLIQKCGLRICPKCSSARFYKTFRRYYPFLKKFEYAKMITFEVKKHYPLSLHYKKELEQKFRNFLRNLERDLQKNSQKFIEKCWIRRKMRAGDYGDIEQTIHLYRNHKVRYIRALSPKKKKENFYYWHIHSIFNLPYIDAKYLAERWSQQTGSSIHIEKVGPLSKEEEKKFKNSKGWKYLRSKYPQEKEAKLRGLWYITKYLVKMETWLSADEYARFAYQKNFVEKSHSKDLIKLGYKATSRHSHSVKVALSTGETLEIPLVFAGIEPISTKPPPKSSKNHKLDEFRLASKLEELKKELIKKESLDLKYAQKHYSKKLINQLSKKGLIIKTFSRIYVR